MADSEFEEFRQHFEQLPQHIKAPSNCYTPEVRVAAPLQEGGVAAGLNRGAGGGGGAAAGDWLTRLEAEVLEARPVAGSEARQQGDEVGQGGVQGALEVDGGTRKETQGERGVWEGVLANHSPANVFMAGVVDLQQAGGEGDAWQWIADWVVVGVNLTVSERLPPLVVGRGRLPSLPLGVASLPILCRPGNLGSSLTEWLEELDHKFLQEERRVALVVVQGSLAPPKHGLKAIELVLLPRAAHPMWGGKLAHRLKRQCVLLQQDKEGGTGGTAPLDVLYRLLVAWTSLTPEDILHAFRVCREHSSTHVGATPSVDPPAVPPDRQKVWAALATLRTHLTATPHAQHAFGHLAALHAFCRVHHQDLSEALPEPALETSV